MLVHVTSAAAANRQKEREYEEWKLKTVEHNDRIHAEVEKIEADDANLKDPLLQFISNSFWYIRPTKETRRRKFELWKDLIKIPEFLTIDRITVKQAVGEDRWFRYHEQLRGNPGSFADESVLKRLEDAIEKLERDLLRAQREERKKARAESIKALAAAFQGKTREQAESIKRALRAQIELYSSCPYCDFPLGEDSHADHIYPVSRGGLSTLDNMVYICIRCNSEKSDMTLREFVKVKSLDWTAVTSVLERLGKRV